MADYQITDGDMVRVDVDDGDSEGSLNLDLELGLENSELASGDKMIVQTGSNAPRYIQHQNMNLDDEILLNNSYLY